MSETKPRASLAFQVFPKVSNGQDAIPIIDAAIEVVKESGHSYEVGPFETTIESEDIDQLMDVVKHAREACIEAGAESVYIAVKIQYSPHGVMSMKDKIHKHRE